MRTYSNDLGLITAKRAHIAKNAARIFAKNGYERTSVREVADACGMAIGALYRYIEKKEDILELVLDNGLFPFSRLYDEYEANLDSISPSEGLRQFIEKYYRMIDNYQDLILLLYQQIRVLSPNIRQLILEGNIRCISIFERLLTRGCETGEFRIHNVLHMAHMIVVLGHMWAVRKWFVGKHYTLEKYISDSVELVITSATINKVM